MPLGGCFWRRQLVREGAGCWPLLRKEVLTMAMLTWPSYMLQAVLDAGMVTGWYKVLGKKTWKAREKAWDQVYREVCRQTGDKGMVPVYFMEWAPILAENEAISKAAEECPLIRRVAPELLCIADCLALVQMMDATITEEELDCLRQVLRLPINRRLDGGGLPFGT